MTNSITKHFFKIYTLETAELYVKSLKNPLKCVSGGAVISD